MTLKKTFCVGCVETHTQKSDIKLSASQTWKIGGALVFQQSGVVGEMGAIKTRELFLGTTISTELRSEDSTSIEITLNAGELLKVTTKINLCTINCTAKVKYPSKEKAIEVTGFTTRRTADNEYTVEQTGGTVEPTGGTVEPTAGTVEPTGGTVEQTGGNFAAA
ncbi:hypothetical protein HDU85_001537 [Gaertneriomyces sp. JEL0708]|nr:hypothetical protein HDU85_001537 [Gaertneriomyces sp. JEL0708]